MHNSIIQQMKLMYNVTSQLIICVFNNKIDKTLIDDIIWYKNENIQVNQRWNMTFSKDSPILSFSSFNHVFHNGLYKCEVVLTNKQRFKSENNELILVKCNFEKCKSFDDDFKITFFFQSRSHS